MKRIFLTNLIADSMFNQLDGENIRVTKDSIENLVDIVKTEKTISAIRNQRLVDTMAERYSVDLECKKIRFQLEAGDVLYVINPGSAADAGTEDLLPDWATISVKKYEVFPKEEEIY